MCDIPFVFEIHSITQYFFFFTNVGDQKPKDRVVFLFKRPTISGNKPNLWTKDSCKLCENWLVDCSEVMSWCLVRLNAAAPSLSPVSPNLVYCSIEIGTIAKLNKTALQQNWSHALLRKTSKTTLGFWGSSGRGSCTLIYLCTLGTSQGQWLRFAIKIKP